jgi:predicted transcriptional regulator
MPTLYRAQILLDPDQYGRLRALAAAEKRSISELVRESIDRHLSSRSADEALQRTLAALDGLAELRARVEVAHRVLPGDFLEVMREERAAEEL